MSGQIVQVQSGQNNISVGKTVLNSLDKAILSRREFNKLDPNIFGATLTDLGPGILTSAPVTLSGITTNAQTVATITPGFAGRVSAVFAVITTAVTTAAKLANIGLFIDQDGAGSAVNTQASGGVIALTSANATPAGKIIPGTRIVWSAANPQDFVAASVLTFITTSLPTAFVEGIAVFGVVLDAPTPTTAMGRGPLLT